MLINVITNYFGNGMSCGVDTVSNLDCDNWDNGVYFIKNWAIVGRKYMRGGEQYEHDLHDMLIDIDSFQPKIMKMGTEKIEEELAKEGSMNAAV